MRKYRFIDLFAGIGGTRIAFEPCGDCVYSCEIDEDAREVYERNWGEAPTETDIRNINHIEDEIPNHDILLACWPCPSFSRFGKKDGLKDERGMLFYEISDILNIKQPKAFMLENVKNLRFVNDGEAYETVVDELESAGYSVFSEVLNALDFGVPQHRERLIIVGFRDDLAPQEDAFEIPKESANALESEKEQRQALAKLLEDDPNEKYKASDKIITDRYNSIENPSEVPEPSVWHENRAGQIKPRPYSSALRASSSWNYILINGQRHPTVRELLRLQGFPEWFEMDGGNQSRARKLTGNTVPVPAIREVAKAIAIELGTPTTQSREQSLADGAVSD
ncbi:DNA cytosine methyltransferase [Halobellus salinisoli]|uniref:DNA cytosine methyltransferase n=1 Tax=Halobellus salinisoli TaxID=3108500 RepID=UPI00300B6954